jgi:hypothetical protein
VGFDKPSRAGYDTREKRRCDRPSPACHGRPSTSSPSHIHENNAAAAGASSGSRTGEGTIAFQDLLEALARSARRFVEGPRRLRLSPPAEGSPLEAAAVRYEPLRRLVITDEVSRTLFTEFAAHRATERGDEETGWVLLGVRAADEALALATLPAGAERSASDSHVLFNSTAQAFGSRVVRQGCRQLTMLGVVHTQPGSLRHPTTGDYRGDIEWVPNLRGGEGIFGIGTADAQPHGPPGVAWQPEPAAQCWGELCLSWYSLRDGDRNYRRLPVELTMGPDLALPLRPVWTELEEHAERLDRLAQQLRQVRFDVVEGREKPALAANVPLPEPGRAIRVLMEGKETRYFLLDGGGEPLLADVRDVRVDQGVYLLLAELAGKG